HGDQDDDPNNNSDCLNSTTADAVTGLGGQASVVRATELEVFSSCNRVNVAAAAAGATASASSTPGSGNFPASAAINGDRTGVAWGTPTGGWNDGTRGVYDDWLQ